MKLQFRAQVEFLLLLTLTFTASALGQAEKTKSAPAPAKTISGSGCVEAGVEAGCLVLKDGKTETLYNLFFSGKKPAINTAIRFTGTAHDGPTTCMQGTAVDVKKFTVIRMRCTAAKAK